MGSGLAGLRMSLLFHMTGLVDLADDAVVESRLPGSFSSPSYASEIRKIVGKHQKWRSIECLNMSCSLTQTGHAVLQLPPGQTSPRGGAAGRLCKATRAEGQHDALCAI